MTNRQPTASEIIESELRQEAYAYGVELARATLDRDALQALATVGWKGATPWEQGTDLDFRCRNAAQDTAKSLIG